MSERETAARESATRLLRVVPARVTVLVEAPRGSFVKHRADGSVDFVSPLPCPFNYGCIPGTRGDDGDPLDVVVLGPRLERGVQVERPVLGLVGFVDAGRADHKLVCGEPPLAWLDRAALDLFFSLYVHAKRLLALTRGVDDGPTAWLGWFPRQQLRD